MVYYFQVASSVGSEAPFSSLGVDLALRLMNLSHGLTSYTAAKVRFPPVAALQPRCIEFLPTPLPSFPCPNCQPLRENPLVSLVRQRSSSGQIGANICRKRLAATGHRQDLWSCKKLYDTPTHLLDLTLWQLTIDMRRNRSSRRRLELVLWCPSRSACHHRRPRPRLPSLR